MHTPSLSEYIGCLDRGCDRGIADLMLASARKLASIGADFLICPDNTIHSIFSLVEPDSPLPWLHIAAVVADEAASHGYRRVGITGTRWLVESNVYSEHLTRRGLEFMRPSVDERQEIHRIILNELVVGVFEPRPDRYIQRVIQHLADQGCDAVVLGCTEIPLIIYEENSPLPTLNSTRLLARAALRLAVHG